MRLVGEIICCAMIEMSFTQDKEDLRRPNLITGMSFVGEIIYCARHKFRSPSPYVWKVSYAHLFQKLSPYFSLCSARAGLLAACSVLGNPI
ncbi:hypothetical protein LOK49_LG09G01759 [Camellia lanceoleosa]|uniref:Uncharacterized protein n=1 Tax=Camellia lanceoleosa TaxID=1840588 RepID=A0ACC0GKI4_9ERIC|nr:hypothetical protein LOK49_LG09G01759 [Camellia lanceoleosa]